MFATIIHMCLSFNSIFMLFKLAVVCVSKVVAQKYSISPVQLCDANWQNSGA